MNKISCHKNWIIACLALLLALVLLLSCLMYAVDPFFQFRVRDNSYMLNPRFASAGLIKNHEYDTLVLGSSMAQNFDMDIFRAELGCRPLKIAVGGLSSQEATEYLRLADKVGKAEHYYICLDLHSYTELSGGSNIPAHLLKDDLLSRLKYLMSYEAWFSFLPVDMGFMLLDMTGITLPPKFSLARSVDDIGNWENDFAYGEEAVRSSLSDYEVSPLDPEGLYQRICINMDTVLSLASELDGQVSFFFPPYSALYWLRLGDSREQLLDAKDYFIRKADAMGMTVYDFQTDALCTDLDNYKDSSHYRGQVNDYMCRCFASGQCIVQSQSLETGRLAIYENMELFKARYPHLSHLWP